MRFIFSGALETYGVVRVIILVLIIYCVRYYFGGDIVGSDGGVGTMFLETSTLRVTKFVLLGGGFIIKRGMILSRTMMYVLMIYT